MNGEDETQRKAERDCRLVEQAKTERRENEDSGD